MRVSRSLFLLFALALTVAGCAGQPAPWLQMASVPLATQTAAVSPSPASGIDTMVYGSVAPAPVAAAPPAAAADRGLFNSAAAPPPVPAPHYVPPPHYAPPPRAMPQPAYEPAPLAYVPAEANRPYTLDSGDRLRIVVFGQDGLSNSYVVDASGYIAMPLIGSVLARGATTDQLSGRIGDKLRQGFVKEPHVAVEIEAYRPFFILGEVTQPGQYPYVADMTVETAVAIAGGFSPRAYRKTVTVTRLMNGEQVRMTVPTSFLLRPGDTVNVQERWF